MAATIETYSAAIEQIAQIVFTTMFNREIVRGEPDSISIPKGLVAAIQINGESWQRTMALSMSSETSRTLAAAMLQIPENEATVADQQEAAAELVNIIGGNLKSLLPGSLVLSLPTVAAGDEVDARLGAAELVDDIRLICDAGALQVRLYVKEINACS